MKTLLEASTDKPRVPEVVNDEHAVTDDNEMQESSGWDAFEVWRTRVKALSKASDRAGGRD